MALVIDRAKEWNVTFQDAYYYIAALSLDAYAGGVGAGSLTLNAHPTPNDWQRPPFERVPVVLGERQPDGGAFPTLAQLKEDPEFAQGMYLMTRALYRQLKLHHALFKDATITEE